MVAQTENEYGLDENGSMGYISVCSSLLCNVEGQETGSTYAFYLRTLMHGLKRRIQDDLGFECEQTVG